MITRRIAEMQQPSTGARTAKGDLTMAYKRDNTLHRHGAILKLAADKWVDPCRLEKLVFECSSVRGRERRHGVTNMEQQGRQFNDGIGITQVDLLATTTPTLSRKIRAARVGSGAGVRRALHHLDGVSSKFHGRV